MLIKNLFKKENNNMKITKISTEHIGVMRKEFENNSCN